MKNHRRTRGLCHSIIEDLGCSIVQGRRPVGDVFDLNRLCEEGEYSRSTLREALCALEAKGLITIRPHHGTQVAPRDQWHLLDPEVIRWQFPADWATASDAFPVGDFGEFCDAVREMRALPDNPFYDYLVRVVLDKPGG